MSGIASPPMPRRSEAILDDPEMDARIVDGWLARGHLVTRSAMFHAVGRREEGELLTASFVCVVDIDTEKRNAVSPLNGAG